MPSLEYALLAEFARVDSVGLLTVVGGGFVRAQLPRLPAQLPVYVAFQVSRSEDEEPSTFEIKAVPPNLVYDVTLSGQVPSLPGLPTIEGRISVPVAVGLMLPVLEEGLYRVDLTLGHDNREMRFLVVNAEPASA